MLKLSEVAKQMRAIRNRAAIGLFVLVRILLLLPLTLLSVFQVGCGDGDNPRTYYGPLPMYGVQISCEKDSDCQQAFGADYVCSTDTKTCVQKS